MFASDYEENYISGWIKIYRSIVNKGWYLDSEYVHLWIHLIIEATHSDREYLWNGKLVNLKAGQFITGRKKLSEKTGINESKIERILNLFESEQQIEQQKTATSRLISITYYSQYQQSEQQSEQRMNNERTTDEQRMNTKQELKHLSIKELKKFIAPSIFEVKAYCLERNNSISPEKFIDYYTSNGWKVGRNHMKDWKAAIRTWEKSTIDNKQQPSIVKI